MVYLCVIYSQKYTKFSLDKVKIKYGYPGVIVWYITAIFSLNLVYKRSFSDPHFISYTGLCDKKVLFC